MNEQSDDISRASVIDPRKWDHPNPAHVIVAREAVLNSITGKSPQGGRWTLPKSISPVDFYAYLKFRFGLPNGFAMTLRTPSVDNLTHWHYTLECPDSIIDILGMDTEIVLCAHSVTLEDSDWHILESRLISEINDNMHPLKKVKNEFEKWHLIVNPYRRLSSIVDQYETRLRQIEIPNVGASSFPLDSKDSSTFRQELRSAINLQREAMSLCVSIEMIVPVMGEAAVNLLLLLLAKPDVRKDKRLMDKFSRDQIDVRIRTLHLHCDGFLRAVPAGDRRFRDFQQVMRKRNELLHGNIDPKQNFGEPIYFDQRHIPLPQTQQSFPEIALTHLMADLTVERALTSVTAVREFVELVIELLRPNLKKVVRGIVNEPLLGIESNTGRIGSILPSVRIAAYPGYDRD